MTILSYICNCKMGFVSNCLKAFKLHMAVQVPTIAAASPNYYLGLLVKDPCMRVSRICCLNSLGTMLLNSRK